MKKRNIIVLSVAAALIAVGAIICGSALAFNGFDITEFDTVDRRMPLSQKIENNFSRVEITVFHDDVTIITSGDYRVDYNESDKEKYSISTENGVLKIAQSSNIKWYDSFNLSFGEENKRLALYLPEKEYDEIIVKSDSGDVYINALCSFDTKISTASGKIELVGISGNNLEADATSGEISATALLLNGVLRLKTASGDIETKGASAVNTEIISSSGECDSDNQKGDMLSVVTASGDISVDAANIKESLNIKTTSGEMELDSINSATVELKSNSGDIEAEVSGEYIYDVNSQSGRVSVPPSVSGGKTFKASAVSGDIEIKR